MPKKSNKVLLGLVVGNGSVCTTGGSLNHSYNCCLMCLTELQPTVSIFIHRRLQHSSMSLISVVPHSCKTLRFSFLYKWSNIIFWYLCFIAQKKMFCWFEYWWSLQTNSGSPRLLCFKQMLPLAINLFILTTMCFQQEQLSSGPNLDIIITFFLIIIIFNSVWRATV